jgi:peptidoglycan/xylan/chitin deacetylase (PgdA/CDA1 family)
LPEKLGRYLFQMLIATNFHYIRENYQTPFPAFFGTTPQKFKNQLSLLGSLGKFIGEDEILNLIRNENPIIGNRWIITFDDGLKEQMEFAFPILIEMGIPAVFYVNTIPLVEKKVLNVHKIHLVRSELAPIELTNYIHSSIKGLNLDIDRKDIHKLGIAHYKYDDPETAELKYLLNFILPEEVLHQIIDSCFNDLFNEEKVHAQLYMDSKDIKKLNELNMLGSHGHDHKPIATLEPEEQIFQISRSAEIFKEIVGSVPSSFSYPYGSKEAVQGLDHILNNESFNFAFTMDRGKNPDIIYKPFLLSRFDNNDLPGGKSWKNGLENPFEILPFSQYQHS